MRIDFWNSNPYHRSSPLSRIGSPCLNPEPKEMVAANHAMKADAWKNPVAFTAVFLGYLVIVLTNLPPIVRSNHVSVNWNMLFIAGAGALGSAIVVVAVFFGPFSKRIGRASATLICVEAGVTLILSTVLLYRSLGFFGVVGSALHFGGLG